MKERAITIPLEKGGAEIIRSLTNVDGPIRSEKAGATDASDAARLWLHVTRAGEERAIYFEQSQNGARVDKESVPGELVQAIRKAAWPEFWTEQLETRLAYEWESPELDPKASYQELGTSLAIDPGAASAAFAEAGLLQQISAYTKALEGVGYRRLRTWIQRGPRDQVFLTGYQLVVDIEHAFYAWREAAVPVDKWVRNTLRSMSNEDAELWENLLAVEPIAAWAATGVLPLTVSESPDGQSILVGR